MASRNERKRLAKARHTDLTVAVKEAFKSEQTRLAAKQERANSIIGVNQWVRKGTHCICHPGLDFVS